MKCGGLLLSSTMSISVSTSGFLDFFWDFLPDLVTAFSAWGWTVFTVVGVYSDCIDVFRGIFNYMRVKFKFIQI